MHEGGASSTVIVTGRDGTLDPASEGPRPDRATLTKMFCANENVVVHLHGGLVPQDSGLRISRRLTDVYGQAGAHPVFVVWESGLLEVLRHNLDEILREDLLQRMLKWVLAFAVGKLRQTPGDRAAGTVPLPKDIEVRGELARRRDGGEPYSSLTPSTDVDRLTADEQGQLERYLQSDAELVLALTAALQARRPETLERGSRGVVVRREGSSSSLMDPHVLAELDAGSDDQRGIVSTALLARKCAAALVRVVARFREDRDHGVYPTVLEELLREFYLANVGGSVWAAMKNETADAFAPGEPARGGRLLLDALADALATGARPTVTLVGHSTGGVYIGNWLREVERGRREGDRPWPQDARFGVAFLAPACTYRHFAGALAEAAGLVDAFRMFTMDDEHEQADRLLGAAYPRSLLYLVSGVLERDGDGTSSVEPLVGMARFLEPRYASAAALGEVRQYLTADRVVLSPSSDSAPPGRRAAATTHTAFDDEPLVLASLQAFVSRRA